MHIVTEKPFTLSSPARALAVTALFTMLPAAAVAQGAATPLSSHAPVTRVTLARVDLPDAPDAPDASSAPAPSPAAVAEPAGSSSSALAEPDPQADVAKTAPTTRTLPTARPQVAGPYQMTIGAGQVAPAMTDRQKVIGGLRDTVSPFSFVGRIISAGYSHAVNGSPNYGTNAPAFGSRIGASFARGSSQNLFTEVALAPLLHEDARYYQLGSSVPFFERVIYAGTRPLITRTDGGRRTPNIALLGGYLGAAYLTQTYNPVLNQSNSETLKIYGTSLGGAAIGDVVTEFLPGFLQVLHLSRFSHL